MIIRRTLLRIPKTKISNETKCVSGCGRSSDAHFVDRRKEVVFMEKPLVSVVMPVYNREDILRKAIESALGQEVPVEVLVIDDCSAGWHRTCCNEIWTAERSVISK